MTPTHVHGSFLFTKTTVGFAEVLDPSVALFFFGGIQTAGIHTYLTTLEFLDDSSKPHCSVDVV